MSMKQVFKTFFTKEADGTTQGKVYTVRISVVALALGAVAFVLLSRTKPLAPEVAVKKTPPQHMTFADDSLDVREIWANRVEKQAETARRDVEATKSEQALLIKRLEQVEELLQKAVEGRLIAGSSASGGQVQPSSPHSQNLGQDSGPQAEIKAGALPKGYGPEDGYAAQPPSRSIGAAQFDQVSTGPRIVHLSIETPHAFKNADSYVPSGSYAKAVLTSGVVVSTAMATQSNPQPIMLRLADSGHLPRGFQSKLKDAVLIGSCYGDLSSERAMCRIASLSYVEEDGTTVEKAVEGWLIGEDGAPGLRGKIVDKSGPAVRESFIAGMLSGMANFLKFESQSNVFPVSPFGQTNALKSGQALQSSAGQGASNALDKLAEFSIKRAESMQPVIVINPGRVIDVVFKKGFDLNGDAVSGGLHLTPAATPKSTQEGY
jgi:conjugal transfer pilus assembly protein TraB